MIKIGDENYHYTSGYYTMNKWIDNDTVVLARSKNPTIGRGPKPLDDKVELVKVSLKDGTVTPLGINMLNYAQHVVWNNKIYYSDGFALKEFDLKTGETALLYEKDHEVEDDSNSLYSGEMSYLLAPHITNDGKYMSVCTTKDKGPTEIIKVDVEKRKGEKVYEKKFEEPFFWANHVMISPENPDLIFFVHEGVTFYIPNRLWLCDVSSGKEWNIAKQTLDENGNLADCFGHEMWAPDGKGLYFVKYKCSPVPPRGICYVDIETGKTELLYSKYGYWHVGVSLDGKFLTADTQTGKDYSEVVVIDMEKGTETIIAEAKTDWVHPSHPHPQLSPDSSKVVYNALDENGRVCVYVVDYK